MVTERSICLDGKTCTAVISDEPEALLAAKAAGRAVVGVESERTGTGPGNRAKKKAASIPGKRMRGMM